MMKKRLLSMLALLMAFCLLFCACTSSSDGTETEDPATDATDAATDDAAEGGDTEGDAEGIALSESADLKMATGGTTGTYYSYGGIVAQVLQDSIEGLTATIHSTGASKANIYEVVDGEADIALVQNDVAYYAFTGTDLFEADGAESGYSIMAGAYAEVCQIVSSADITSIADLKGKVVSVGDAGSGVEFNAKQILEAYGITFDDIQVQNLSFGDSAEALKDGKIDAFFCVAGAPTTAIVDLCTSKEANLLEVDDEHAEALMEKYGFYTLHTVPGGTYNGIDEDVQTVAVKATFIVSDDLSDEVVYAMTKTLFEKAEEIGASHEKGSELDVNYAVEGFADMPFHPGAIQYYEEVGAM